MSRKKIVIDCRVLRRANCKPNSTTLSGRRQVRSW